MSRDKFTRRRATALAGSALAALAGCTSPSDGGSQAQNGTTETDDHGGTDDHHEETDGSDHHDDGHALPEEPSESATVTMLTDDSGTHFDPHLVWVTPGSTVTWELESGSHTATAYHPDNDSPRRVPEGAAAFDLSLSETGATASHTFESAGVYDYFCRPHEASGMIGTVVVGEPDAHGQPGLAEPQQDLPQAAREKITSLNEKANQVLGHTH